MRPIVSLGPLVSFTFVIIWFLLQSVQSLYQKSFRVIKCGKRHRFRSNSLWVQKPACPILDSLTLEHWGVFDQASISLGESCFTAVTGETASGKSVLLSALQFLCEPSSLSRKKKTKSILSAAASSFGKLFDCATCQEDLLVQVPTNSSLTLTTCDGRTYRRYYDRNSRKFISEIDGTKFPQKAISESLGHRIHFWAPEDIAFLKSGPDGFLSYVDANICGDDCEEHPVDMVVDAFDRWFAAYNDLDRLQKLESRAALDDEAGLLSFYASEVTALEEKMVKLLENIREVSMELNEVRHLIPNHRSSKETLNREDVSELGSNDATGDLDILLDLVSDILRAQTPSLSTEAVTAVPTTIRTAKKVTTKLKRAKPTDNGNGSTPPVTSSLKAKTTNTSVKNKMAANNPHTQTRPDDDSAWRPILPVIDLSKCRSVMELATRIFSTVSREMAATFPPSAIGKGGGNGGQSVNTRRAFDGATSVPSIVELEKIVEEYSVRVLRLQDCFRMIGCTSAGLEQRLEGAQVALQDAVKGLREAKVVMNDIRRSVPDTAEVLEEIIKVGQEWDALCRKHGVKSTDLQTVRDQWLRDVASLTNLVTELPRLRQKESAARASYTRLAYSLTTHRIRAAAALLKKVNDVLPNLEMRDKLMVARIEVDLRNQDGFETSFSNLEKSLLETIPDAEKDGVTNGDTWSIEKWGNTLAAGVTTGLNGVTVSSLSVNTLTEKEEACLLHAIAENLRPGGRIGRYGWDSVDLLVYPRDQGRLEPARGPSTMSSAIAPVDINIVIGEDVMSPSSPQKTKFSLSGLAGAVSLPIDTLSSGETTRLALAMELCSGMLYDENDNMNQGIVDESTSLSKTAQQGRRGGLLVLDEIDSHVGGEAAVSVARLLRQQGRQRQVVAVTHNAVIAAAADRHFVVSKIVPSSSNDLHKNIPENANLKTSFEELDPQSDESISKGNTQLPHRQAAAVGGPRSTLKEVQNEDRVHELARMATGKLDTDAGLALARALLAAKYD